MLDKTRLVELFTESVREIGILFLVFAPLDAATATGLPLGVVILIVLVALFVIVAGIIVGTWKRG
jgi:hypothetical protein